MFGQNSNQNSSSDKLFIATSSAGSDLGLTGADTEGQLSIDVLETESDLVVVATMAGTKPEDIVLHLHNDFLTIRGRRSSPVAGSSRYFYEECYWGKFSRTIVLPMDVKGDMATSEYKNGVLTIRIPKTSVQQNIPILVVED
ncbi:MAG: Hsp20/alpha crystallin family protein [Patescibacteria group bacterium]